MALELVALGVLEPAAEHVDHLVDGADVNVACVLVLVVDVLHGLGKGVLPERGADQDALGLVQGPPEHVLHQRMRVVEVLLGDLPPQTTNGSQTLFVGLSGSRQCSPRVTVTPFCRCSPGCGLCSSRWTRKAGCRAPRGAPQGGGCPHTWPVARRCSSWAGRPVREGRKEATGLTAAGEDS